MGYKAIKIENNLVRTFLVSDRKDIDENKLPTNTTIGTNGIGGTIDNQKVAVGSIAVCVEDWSKWILSLDNKWIKMPDNGNVGGNNVDFNVITQLEVDEIFNSL